MTEFHFDLQRCHELLMLHETVLGDNETTETIFAADGAPIADVWRKLCENELSLYFQADCSRKSSEFWNMKLWFPPSLKANALIRAKIHFSVPPEQPVKIRYCNIDHIVRANGAFEISLADFQRHMNITDNSEDRSEIYVEFVSGTRMGGKLQFINPETKKLTATMVCKWAERPLLQEIDEHETADLLNDFGVVLPFFLFSQNALAGLDLDHYGITGLDRRKIPFESNEAWILFSNRQTCLPSSPISPHGFLLPLEWRFEESREALVAKLLPENLLRLAKKVKQQFGGDKWNLYPSLRFFRDRIDFSDPELFGEDDESIASAWSALAVGLVYAKHRLRIPEWPFSSIQFDFEKMRVKEVSGITDKMTVAADFGGRSFFARQDAPLQNGIKLIKIQENDPKKIIDRIAYDHLDFLRPETTTHFAEIREDLYTRRYEILKKLGAAANLEHDDPKGNFVVLFGNPGMGKSVLIGKLSERFDLHQVICFICRAGQLGQEIEFIKTVAFSLASRYSELADYYQEIKKHPVFNGALDDLYRKLVLEPLTLLTVMRKSEHFYLLVDGLDEDDSGKIAELLTSQKLALPIPVVVSSRRVGNMEKCLQSRATSIIDLNGSDEEIVKYCKHDLGRFIDHMLYCNEELNRKFVESSGITTDELHDFIIKKDPSFLYASHVLLGLAEGRYSFDKLKKELPDDLQTCFFESFKARFPRSGDYERVKPLLRLLVKENSVEIRNVSERLSGQPETIGQMVSALRGYCQTENDRLKLSSISLREWLADTIHNPEFGV